MILLIFFFFSKGDLTFLLSDVYDLIGYICYVAYQKKNSCLKGMMGFRGNCISSMIKSSEKLLFVRTVHAAWQFTLVLELDKLQALGSLIAAGLS